MTKVYVSPFLAVLLLVFFASCEIINPDEDIPAYIHIETIELDVSNPNAFGSSSNKITEAWVNIGGADIGVFELPATIPVVKTGPQNVFINAGIKRNGISATREVYPFYRPFIQEDVNFVAESVVVVNPVVDYLVENAFTLHIVEDFEDPISLNFDTLSGSTVDIENTFEVDQNRTFEGLGSGIIQLTTDNPAYVGRSNTSYALPTLGARSFIEMDYNTSTLLDVRVLANISGVGTEEHQIITLVPTDRSGVLVWNKIYIDLTEIVNRVIIADSYQILFVANIEGTSASEATVMLDNIKMVHQ